MSLSTAQRSAQELPLVEKQSMDSCPATGGKMILLNGLNFLPESKVVFVEKAQGKLQSPGHVYRISISLFNTPFFSFSLTLVSCIFLVSPPVKIEQDLPASHMWCALGHYIFNQSVFTFAEVSIACSAALATS